MKSFSQIVLALLIGLIVCGQKPSIHAGLYDNWPTVDGGIISNDGAYIIYKLTNYQPAGAKEMLKEITFIESTKSGWKLELPEVSSYNVSLSANSRLAYVTRPDTLEIYKLGTNKKETITGIDQFAVKQGRDCEWLAFKYKNTNTLLLRNLCTGKGTQIPQVLQYVFSADGESVVVSKAAANAENNISLGYINIKNGSENIFWEGENASDITVSRDGKHVAFKTTEKQKTALYYYQAGSNKANRLTDDSCLGMEKTLLINGIVSFSDDGSRLFFTVKQEENLPATDPDAVRLDIWTWFDVRLQSQQLKEGPPSKVYAAVIALSSGRVLRLEQEDEKIDLVSAQNGDVVLVKRSKPGAFGEVTWNKSLSPIFFLININNGKRTALPTLTGGYSNYIISPDKKYLLSYRPEEKKYYSYNIPIGEWKVISGDIKYFGQAPLNERPHGGYRFHSYFQHVGWTPGGEGAFFYDTYDIWLFDLSGSKAPVNLTNGYGRKNNIRLRFTDDTRRMPLTLDKKSLLVAFNFKTKENGFFEKVLGKTGDPTLLTMGSYVYHVESPGYAGGRSPEKAKNADIYLVQRMSANESPNYFLTKDFKRFRRVTDLHPERNYNWYTTELHEWNLPDGRPAQGILYKPEDFDARKKYPVIFYYYETRTESLNDCMKPAASFGNLNVLWYVSNGYLVFSPDVYYTLGDPGGSCANSVLSGAEYISRFPYVNTRKMGIQGISFGGFETNYLVANSSIFAAACTASGASDLISEIGSIANGVSIMPMVEQGQYRMDASLWERPDLYLKNSPVLRADKVVTPLLIFHTSVDDAVPFQQSIQFFTALRRLGKKVWMLEYNDGNHGVIGKDAIDFDRRLQQYFNYYLKDSLPPQWMTKGRPAYLKGIDQRLDLDSSAVFPDKITY